MFLKRKPPQIGLLAIASIFLLSACGREEAAAPAPAAPAVTTTLPSQFVGEWAPDPTQCSTPWMVTEKSLATPGGIRCDFKTVTATGGVMDVAATCVAEGPPQERQMKFAPTELAGGMLVDGGPFGDQGLVRCDAPPAPPAPGTPGGLPDDRTPVSEAPFTPDSAQGAGNVLQTYYALMADKKYGEAWNLWAAGSETRQQSAADFARSYDAFATYNANIGAPGKLEGAAGSVFVKVPVQVYARRRDGMSVNLVGSATLRRSNGVPGATKEQLAWRIQSIDVAAPKA